MYLGETHLFLVVNTFDGQFGLRLEMVVLEVVGQSQVVCNILQLF